jgi:hypothetical protein
MVPASNGHSANGFYNSYQVRDAWWENKTGPLTLFIGNQIAVWGQSLAFRVGDVINPQDVAWNFGFANLEQSRNPQWMIHPILNLPEWGPFSTNFIELVWQPGFQPQWWEDSYPDGRFTGPGGDVKDGRAITAGLHAEGDWRFSVHYDTHFIEGMNAATGKGPFNRNGGGFFPPGGPAGGVLVGPPFVHTFWECFGGGALGFNPLPPGLRSATGCAPGHGLGIHGNQALGRHNLRYGPAGNFSLFNSGPWRIPGMQPENWNEGVRFHSLWGSTEWTLLYYNDNVNGGIPVTHYIAPYYTNLMQTSFPAIQEVGVTADRPLPIPSSLGEYFPAVGRAEALYVNHAPYYDNRPLALSAIRYSDQLKWMVAVDIDQAYAPWLTETGNLSANMEVYDAITMDNSKLTPAGALNSERNLKNNVLSLFSIGTSWWWNEVAPTWTMIYQPKGTTFAMFPSLVLNPPWTRSYFVKLQAIEVLGGDKEQTLGLFKGESLLTAQFQYNFNLM